MATNHEELLRRHFALVDAAFCFVAKHRAAPNVRGVLRVVNSFGSSQLTRQHLVELAAIAPDLLVLETPKTNFQPRSGIACIVQVKNIQKFFYFMLNILS